MAVDPHRLFVYWELTDEAIERARAVLDPDADAATLVLRVYDITGRIFDGTNAHGHFDHPISRDDRRWFFDIHKPGSVAVVELGLRSAQGRFVKIARSSRAEFPRDRPPAAGAPGWLTVRVQEGHAEGGGDTGWSVDGGGGSERPAGAPPASPAGAPPAPPTGSAVPAGQEAGEAPGWSLHERPQDAEAGESWVQLDQPLESWTAETRSFHWEMPPGWSRWEHGPVSSFLEAQGAWSESWFGEPRVFEGVTGQRIVTGPWEVVIRGLDAFRRRSVVARWEFHRSWVHEEGREVIRADRLDAFPAAGSSGRLARGASERRWLAGSELRLSGSSEMLYAGASERRLRGASERLLRGASERILRGASERLLRGASERRLGGASERRLGGASERRLGGASERRLGGASERRLGGASERRLGGASERTDRCADAPDFPGVEDAPDDE
jgi:hypothetical protein